MRNSVLILAMVALFLVVYIDSELDDRPSLDHYATRVATPLDPAAGGLRATFFGVSTLLLDDGKNAILVDGFFTRPSLLRTLLARVAPDEDVIEWALKKAGIAQLGAVLVVHSHYDHAMDAPAVAERTGALLVGSESTANIGRGAGLAEDRIRVIADGDEMHFGSFHVTMIRSRHFPHGLAMGEISKPLSPPARATAYREGGSYSVLVEHRGRSLLVQGSAGYLEGALRGRQAEVVFLGLAGLGTRDDLYRRAYWRETVQAVGAKRVIPIHWDDFTRPLVEPLLPMPRVLDDLDVTLRFLQERSQVEGVDLRLLPAWMAIDPFTS